MNSAELGNLTLLARTAYAIMCFERYAAFMYSDTDFRPVAEMMWRIVDGSEPLEEAAYKYLDIVPECLFAHKTFAEYQAAGHTRLTQEQYRMLTRILNPHDWNLNKMMKHIYHIAMEYVHTGVKPGAPETLPYLQAVIDMLTVRRIELPDLILLQQYSCTQQDPLAARSFDWMGGPVDPAKLSLLGIAKRGASAAAPASEAASFVPEPAEPDEIPAVRSVPEADEAPAANNLPLSHGDSEMNVYCASSAGYDGFDRSYTNEKTAKSDTFSFFEDSVQSIADENGCKWEFGDTEGGCIIIKCINHAYLKDVTVPAVLNDQPVVAIDDNAFTNTPEYGCEFIETLSMPDTIRQIGDYFFKSCPNLRRIHMPAELERLGNEAFRGASRLESMTIGDKCRVIGDYFCADAVSLRDVTLGTAIEYIGEYTFYNTPCLTVFRCDAMIKELGYGSFWVNKWADKTLFSPDTELLRCFKDGCMLYRYVKRTPPPRLFFDAGIKYVYDFAFGGDAWHSGDGITDIYFPGAVKIGVQAFRKTPNATVHLSASLMEAAYGPDYEYTLMTICKPARVVFDQP